MAFIFCATLWRRSAFSSCFSFITIFKYSRVRFRLLQFEISIQLLFFPFFCFQVIVFLFCFLVFFMLVMFVFFLIAVISDFCSFHIVFLSSYRCIDAIFNSSESSLFLFSWLKQPICILSVMWGSRHRHEFSCYVVYLLKSLPQQP